MYRLVKVAEFGYHIHFVSGFCCYFCHVGVIIKVGFISGVLRYVFELSTLFKYNYALVFPYRSYMDLTAKVLVHFLRVILFM